MADCKYCTNYFLNLNNRVDDSCMGQRMGKFDNEREIGDRYNG